MKANYISIGIRYDNPLTLFNLAQYLKRKTLFLQAESKGNPQSGVIP